MIHVDETKWLRYISKIYAASLLLALLNETFSIDYDLIKCRRHAPRSTRRFAIPAQSL